MLTGISRGIGRATAEYFLENGWFVVGTSTTGASTLSHANLTLLQLDLGNAASIAACVSSIRKEGWEIDVLINNAGINPGPDTYPLSIPILRSTLEVDLIGLIDFTEQLLPFMHSEGRIINLTSSAGIIANDAMQVPLTPYRIAKAGLNMYTHTLASRLASQGITVAACHPGWVRTDMGSSHAPKLPQEVAEELFWLATEDIDSGHLWENKRITNW
ncbi:MAG: hypothetical protein JWM39_66 [Parcubacteria group bacterium]|nr:hypothetical protein [Parcubacteria group bacterium]